MGNAMRRLIAVLAGVVLVGLTVALPARADTADSGPGLSALTACASQHRNLDVLVLMDESGSLSEAPNATDPDDQRVVALTRFLEGLAEAPSDGPTINVELDGFAANFNDPANSNAPVKPFAPLTETSLSDFQQAAAAFKDLDKGQATDYGIAIQNARDRLVHQAVSREGPSCQVIVLFTDGRYDSGGQSGDDAGRAALCPDGGTIDQMRNDGVALVAVGLGTDPASLLKLMVGAGPCGAVLPTTGLYLPANNVEALISSFGLMGEIFKGGTYAGPDPSDPRPFYLGADLTSVRLFAQLPDAATVPILQSPSGATLSADGTQSPQILDGVRWDVVRSDPRIVRLSGTPSPDAAAWVGEWSVRASKAASQGDSVFDIVRFPDLRPVIDGAPTVTMGDQATIKVVLQRLNGQPPTSAQTQQPHRLTVKIVDPTHPQAEVTASPIATDSGYSFDYTPDALSGASTVNVVTALDALAPDGSTLTTVTTTSALKVQPPSTFPKLEIDELDLGAITDDQAVEREIAVVGGAGAGCVAVGQLTVSQLPEGVSSLTSNSAGSPCVSVAAGEHRSIPVRFEHKGLSSGHVRGDLLVTLSDASNKQVEVHIPVRATFDPPVDPGERLMLLIALIAAGALIPLLIMHLVARFAGRFAPRHYVRYVTIPVSVGPLGVSSDHELTAPALIGKMKPVPEDQVSATRIIIPNGPVLRRRLPINPFGAPIASTEPFDKDVVGSAGVSGGGDKRFVGRIPTRLGASWLFSTEVKLPAEDSDPTLTGDLTLLVSDTPTSADPLSEAIANALRNLSTLAAPLFAAQNEARAESDSDSPERDSDAPEPEDDPPIPKGDDGRPNPGDYDPFA